jgi:hypothetical protein
MSYDLGNTDVITYDGSDVEKLNLNGTTIWEKQLLEVNYTAGYDSLSVAITASKSVAYVQYNLQPRHGGLTWKNPYSYDVEYSFDYSAGLPYYQIEYNANNGTGFQPLSPRYEYVSTDGTSLNWEQAKNAAIARGGKLASPKSSADLAKLNTYLNTVNIGVGAWIGLKKDGNDWKWVDGSVSAINNWLSGEPNNAFGNESYVHVLNNGVGGSTNYNWNDVDLAASNASHWGNPRFGYIIEYDEGRIYQNSGEDATAWRLRSWAAVKPLIEADGGSITSFTVTDRSTSGDIVFQNTPANYTAQVKVHYTDGTVEDSVAESVSILGDIIYTATKANVHSRNPLTVAGYGCAYQADLGWSVYRQSGQLYIAIGYMSSVHHGSADQNTLRNATHESLLAEYNEHGPHAADQSPFIENVKLPLTYPEEWVYGQQSKVFGHQGGFAFGNPVISYAASNGWIFAAKLKSDGRIEVAMNGRNGTGDDGSTMSLNALNCAFNIVADRPNGTAITPYIFNYE